VIFNLLQKHELLQLFKSDTIKAVTKFISGKKSLQKTL